MKRLILASQSPGKKMALEKLGVPFEAIPSEYVEDMTLEVSPAELALILSGGKAKDLAAKHTDAVIIGADTFVVFEDRLIGKPKDVNHARETLRMLSGNTHSILTGITIIEGDKMVPKVVETKVTFKPLNNEIIEEYVISGEPHGKAGSYAIQGEGRKLIEKIEGDHHNIMGMPLDTLVEILNKDFGFEINYESKSLF